jgi:hypothetical protein
MTLEDSWEMRGIDSRVNNYSGQLFWSPVQFRIVTRGRGVRKKEGRRGASDLYRWQLWLSVAVSSRALSYSPR